MNRDEAIQQAQADARDAFALAELARQTIINVMQRNVNREGKSRWRDLSRSDLLDHAVKHLEDPKSNEDIMNALTRLSMILLKAQEALR